MRVLALRNRQRVQVLNTPLLRQIILHLLHNEFAVKEYELGFHFVPAMEMARVNQQFLQHEGSTDVITFDYMQVGASAGDSADFDPRAASARSQTDAPMLSGEIFISVQDAVAQAKEFGTTWQSELTRYAIHGLLHLRGYDDLQSAKRKLMKREENRLLRKVAATFALRSLAGSGRTSETARHS